MAEEIEKRPALPVGFEYEQEVEERPKLPEGFQYEDEEPVKNPFKDVVSEELAAQGIEGDFSEELERRAELGTAEATRGLAKGATLGFSELVPGLETGDTLAAKGGEVVGSLIPISRLINVFGGAATKLASKSPILQKQLSALGHLLGVGATGATVHEVEELAKGRQPSADDLIEKGIEWSLLDFGLGILGKTFQFGKALLSRSKATGESSYEALNNVLNEVKASGGDVSTPEAVGAKALEIINKPVESVKAEIKPTTVAKEGLTPTDLKTKKVSEEPINRLNEESIRMSEAYQPARINLSRESQALDRTAIEERIEGVGERAVTDQDLGHSIREDINNNLQAAREEYAPLYRQAEQAAENLTHTPQNTAREAGNRITRLERIRTRPANYQSTIRQLETILEDAGYTIQRDEAGNIERILQNGPVSVADSIELGRRVNSLIDFELIDPNVKNILRPVVRAIKTDVRAGLGANPDALAAYELAEAEHARVSQLFNRDSIRKIRSTESGERVAGIINSGTAAQDVRAVVSPAQQEQIEREILERLNNKNYEQARKQLREVERNLSGQNRALARDIVEAKNPHNTGVRNRLTQQGILDDISSAFNKGTRPDKTLNLWKTPKGQRLVRDAFRDSPNWAQVRSYLEKQSFNDMVASVLKPNGTIDFQKFNTFMKDPAAVQSIRDLGGEQAVSFFRGLETRVKQFESNAKILERIPKKQELDKASRGKELLERMSRKDYPAKAKLNDWNEWIKETLGLNAKATLSIFGISKLGAAGLGGLSTAIPTAVIGLIGYRLMNKLLTSPRARKAFIEMTKKHTDPIALVAAIEAFGKTVEED